MPDDIRESSETSGMATESSIVESEVISDDYEVSEEELDNALTKCNEGTFETENDEATDDNEISEEDLDNALAEYKGEQAQAESIETPDSNEISEEDLDNALSEYNSEANKTEGNETVNNNIEVPDNTSSESDSEMANNNAESLSESPDNEKSESNIEVTETESSKATDNSAEISDETLDNTATESASEKAESENNKTPHAHNEIHEGSDENLNNKAENTEFPEKQSENPEDISIETSDTVKPDQEDSENTEDNENGYEDNNMSSPEIDTEIPSNDQEQQEKFPDHKQELNVDKKQNPEGKKEKGIEQPKRNPEKKEKNKTEKDESEKSRGIIPEAEKSDTSNSEKEKTEEEPEENLTEEETVPEATEEETEEQSPEELSEDLNEDEQNSDTKPEQIRQPERPSGRKTPEPSDTSEESEAENERRKTPVHSYHGGGSGTPVMSSPVEISYQPVETIPLDDTVVLDTETTNEKGDKKTDDQASTNDRPDQDNQKSDNNEEPSTQAVSPINGQNDPNESNKFSNSNGLNGSISVNNSDDPNDPAKSPNPIDPDSAYRALVHYMQAHNYGRDDFEQYQKDPEWQLLHKAAFPEWHSEHKQQEIKGANQIGDVFPSEKQWGTRADVLRQVKTAELMNQYIEYIPPEVRKQIQIASRYQEIGMQNEELNKHIQECADRHARITLARELLKNMPETADTMLPEQQKAFNLAKEKYRQELTAINEFLRHRNMSQEEIDRFCVSETTTSKELRNIYARLSCAVWDQHSELTAKQKKECPVHSAEYILRNGSSMDVTDRYPDINPRNVACMLALQNLPHQNDEIVLRQCEAFIAKWNSENSNNADSHFSEADLREIRQGASILHIQSFRNPTTTESPLFLTRSVEQNPKKVEIIEEKLDTLRKELQQHVPPVPPGPWLEKRLSEKRQELTVHAYIMEQDSIPDPAIKELTVEDKDYCDKTVEAFRKHCLDGTNPDYLPFDKYSPFYNNCQRCVYTYVMRRNGEEVSAAPRPRPLGESDELSSYDGFLNGWENPVRHSVPPDSTGETEITQSMDIWGDGALVQIAVLWDPMGGHTFLAERINGQIEFIDPQNPDLSSENVKDFFKDVKKGKTVFCRVDGLKIKESYRSTILKGS